MAWPFRCLLVDTGEVVRDGYLIVKGGLVAGIRTARPRGVRIAGREPRVLVPGLVNAHGHVEIGPLGGSAGAFARFTAWIEAVLRAPRATTRSLESRARALRASGVVAAADHDASGRGARALQRAGLRGVAYREFFAFDPATAAQEARGAAGAARAAVAGSLLRPGLAPHAPHTVAFEGLRAAVSCRLPISIHVAESEDEVAWCRSGTGPLEDLLVARGRRPRLPVPRVRPVAWLDRAGLLAPQTLAVHANHLTRAELARLAAAGCTAVHCPGTHAYFRRGTPPVRAWIQARVPFALGTDSLASNDALDLFLEMNRLHRADPSIEPDAIVAAATLGGARALGLWGLGTLRPGSIASFVVLDLDVNSSSSGRSLRHHVLEGLLQRPSVVEVVAEP